MNRKEAQHLAREIESDDKYMMNVGLRRYDTGSYAVEATDGRTGYSIVVNSPEEWDQRMMEAERYRKAEGGQQ